MVERMQKGRAFTEVQWIPVKQLSVVWAGAQRPLNERHARKIADNFDPELVGTLSVTKPNSQGIYHLIDGQHRKVAIEMKWGKDERAPCHVFDAVEPARAAELFDNMNTARRAPGPVDLFKVRVTAKEKVQVAVNEIVLRCGLKIGYKGHNIISCVGALEFVYNSYGPVVLEATLRCLRQTWGDDSTAVSAAIVRGFGMFLSEFRHVDHKRLVDAVSAKYTPARFLSAAKAARENFGGDLSANSRDLIIRIYNEKTRSKKEKLILNKKDK